MPWFFFPLLFFSLQAQDQKGCLENAECGKVFATLHQKHLALSPQKIPPLSFWSSSVTPPLKEALALYDGPCVQKKPPFKTTKIKAYGFIQKATEKHLFLEAEESQQTILTIPQNQQQHMRRVFVWPTLGKGPLSFFLPLEERPLKLIRLAEGMFDLLFLYDFNDTLYPLGQTSEGTFHLSDHLKKQTNTTELISLQEPIPCPKETKEVEKKLNLTSPLECRSLSFESKKIPMALETECFP